eukprot:1161097-Pelagomonas_calceolata.AAC.9
MTWAGRLGIDGDEQTASLVDLPHGVVANLMPPPRRCVEYHAKRRGERRLLRYMLVSHASGSPCIPPAVPPSPSSECDFSSGSSSLWKGYPGFGPSFFRTGPFDHISSDVESTITFHIPLPKALDFALITSQNPLGEVSSACIVQFCCPLVDHVLAN